MARIRTIKPSFFTSLTMCELTFEQRLTFIGLWTHCDDEGRCIYDPRLIKAAIWPLDDRSTAAVAADIGALSESSLITHYRVGDREYLAVVAWAEHQRINRPTPSLLPGPNDGLTCEYEDSVSDHGALTDSSLSTHRGNKEGNKEGNGVARKRAHQLPDDFQPNDHHRELGADHRVNIDFELAKFKDYYRGTGKPMKDWDATFNNWIRNSRPSSGTPTTTPVVKDADYYRNLPYSKPQIP